MKMAVIPIGNSKGLRIPKPILTHCHITKSVDIEVKGDSLIIRPVKDEPRKDWEQAFKRMYKNKDDRLIVDDALDIDAENWQWQ